MTPAYGAWLPAQRLTRGAGGFGFTDGAGGAEKVVGAVDGVVIVPGAVVAGLLMTCPGW